MKGASAFVTILDKLSATSAAAFSTRLLRSAYTGKCMNVRRSSDNAAQDIGFVNGVLDTASLLAFVGAGNGFVTTWYDQSGNGYNSTQATATNQPTIASSGAIVTLNGKPTIGGYNGAGAALLTNNSSFGPFAAPGSFNAVFGVKDTGFFGAIAGSTSGTGASSSFGSFGQSLGCLLYTSPSPRD